jgi:Ras-related C3 botulinum toxin substrate 1
VSTDVFLVCYDVSSRASFDNVVKKWVPELKQYSPDSPNAPLFVLVGLKADKRGEHEALPCVGREEGERVGREMGAKGFYEASCASSQLLPLDDMFKSIVKVTTEYEPPEVADKSSKFFFFGRKPRGIVLSSTRVADKS